MFSKHDQLQGYDDELLAAMDAEDRRQEDHIELIASENYASKRVMQAQGSGLTNKYAEGYPGKRYYGIGRQRRRGGLLFIAAPAPLQGCAEQHGGKEDQRAFHGVLAGRRARSLAPARGVPHRLPIPTAMSQTHLPVACIGIWAGRAGHTIAGKGTACPVAAIPARFRRRRETQRCSASMTRSAATTTNCSPRWTPKRPARKTISN